MRNKLKLQRNKIKNLVIKITKNYMFMFFRIINRRIYLHINIIKFNS